MKKVVINGYKGFIATNYFKKYKNIQKIIHYKKDINNLIEFKKFITKKKPTHLIHLAGLSRVNCINNSKDCVKTNFQSIKKIISYLNTLKNKPFFIFISSCHVYAPSHKKLKENSKLNPKDLYGNLKLKSEIYIKKNYKNHCILRLFNVHGKNPPKGIFHTDMLHKLKNNQSITINNSIRDFIHVNEVSKIIYFIIKKNIKKTINLGSGLEYKLEGIIKNLIKKNKIRKHKVTIKNKKDKIVADISLLKKLGYKSVNNDKYINF